MLYSSVLYISGHSSACVEVFQTWPSDNDPTEMKTSGRIELTWGRNQARPPRPQGFFTLLFYSLLSLIRTIAGVDVVVVVVAVIVVDPRQAGEASYTQQMREEGARGAVMSVY